MMATTKRHRAIEELVETEGVYAKDLRDVQRGYIDAIPESILSPEEKFAIFGNWRQLVNFHERFSEKLKAEAKHSPGTVARCFLEVNFTPLYTRLCCYHDRQLSILAHRQETDKRLATLLQTCQENLGHRLPLKDYLLTPVQRIMRYHLLLAEQDKHTGEEEPGKALLAEAHAAMRDTAKTLNERRRAAQVQDLVLGSVWLSRTMPLHERITGLTVDFAALGQLLAFMPEAQLLMDGKQGRPSQRMILCFQSGIISCKEREHQMLSVKAEYNLAACRLRILDSHRFAVVVGGETHDYDTYHVTNTDVKALLSELYPTEASPTDAALSPNTRRHHRILGNVLKPSARERVFSTGKKASNTSTSAGATTTTATAAAAATTTTANNHLAVPTSPPDRPQSPLATAEPPSSTTPQQQQQQQQQQQGTDGSLPPDNTADAAKAAAPARKRSGLQLMLETRGSSDSVVDDAAADADLETWLREVVLEDGSPGEFLAVQRLLRGKLTAMDAKVKVLTQELQSVMGDSVKTAADGATPENIHTVHYLQSELIKERLHAQELRSNLHDRDEDAKAAHAKAEEATTKLKTLQETVDNQAEQVKKLLGVVDRKDEDISQLTKELEVVRTQLQEREATVNHAQNQYRNASQRLDSLQLKHAALQVKYEEANKERKRLEARVSELEEKFLSQQARFSAELDHSRGPASPSAPSQPQQQQQQQQPPAEQPQQQQQQQQQHHHHGRRRRTISIGKRKSRHGRSPRRDQGEHIVLKEGGDQGAGGDETGEDGRCTVM